jgi:hypothetical protein
VDHALDANRIISDFKKQSARWQTHLLVGTDYGAFFPLLIEHYKGPKDLMLGFLEGWNASIRNILVYDRKTFDEFYPERWQKLREIEITARLMDV